MIREKAVNCKLDTPDISDRRLFESATPSGAGCPSCGAGPVLDPHGSYERHMISIIGGDRVDDRVEVARARCPSCPKTHALLPDNLIPHGSYTLLFIMHVLRAYLNRDCSVEKLCARYQIAISTLYAWKHRFREHTDLLLESFRRLRGLSADALGFIAGIPALPSSFFTRFGFSFLQNQKQRIAVHGSG